MSKLQQIVTYLESEKLDVAVVSDPVTINYLTGFYSDPHERQMFLFVLADQEPLLFVPASRLSVQVAPFPSQLWAMWILKIHGKKWNMLFHNLTSNVSLLNLTSYLDQIPWLENSLWDCWVWKPHSPYPTHAPHQISWRSAKNDGCRSLCGQGCQCWFWQYFSW